MYSIAETKTHMVIWSNKTRSGLTASGLKSLGETRQGAEKLTENGEDEYHDI